MSAKPRPDAFDLVASSAHPSPDRGGPCRGCAFRAGTEANESEHTRTLARLCVDGLRLFHCHEEPRLCRGWIAAINVRGVPVTEEEERATYAAGLAADALAAAIRTSEGGGRRTRRTGHPMTTTHAHVAHETTGAPTARSTDRPASDRLRAENEQLSSPWVGRG